MFQGNYLTLSATASLPKVSAIGPKTGPGGVDYAGIVTIRSRQVRVLLPASVDGIGTMSTAPCVWKTRKGPLGGRRFMRSRPYILYSKIWFLRD